MSNSTISMTPVSSLWCRRTSRQDAAAGLDHLAHLGFHAQPGSSGTINSVREPSLIMPNFCPAPKHFARPQTAHDPPGELPGDLPHDQPPVRRRFLPPARSTCSRFPWRSRAAWR